MAEYGEGSYERIGKPQDIILKQKYQNLLMDLNTIIHIYKNI